MILNAIRKFKFVNKFYSSGIGQRWISAKLNPVLPFLNENFKILDAGCGNCLITQSLRQKGFDCTPLDVDNLSIIDEVQPVVYDGLSIPFEDKSFDVALLLTVLHHTPDPIPVLEECARVSKKIIITEDIYSNRLQQYLTYAMDTIVNFGHSQMTYQNKSDEEWKTAFEHSGLQLIEESSRSVLLFFRQATYVLSTS